MKANVNIAAELNDEVTRGHVRYTFKIFSGKQGEVVREFIIDVPQCEDEITDVWVLGHRVAVGDTPADGFATYTPSTEVPTEPVVRQPTLIMCSYCGHHREVHFEGWFYDHASNTPGVTCEGSGQQA